MFKDNSDTKAQWSFRKNRNNGNAGEPSRNWCLGPSTGNASVTVLWGPGYQPEKILRLHMQNPAIWCIFGILKHVNNGNAIHIVEKLSE